MWVLGAKFFYLFIEQSILTHIFLKTIPVFYDIKNIYLISTNTEGIFLFSR